MDTFLKGEVIMAESLCIKEVEQRYIKHFWKTLLENYLDSECQLLETTNEESPGVLLQRFYIYRSKERKISILVPNYLASEDEGLINGSPELPIEMSNAEFRERDKQKLQGAKKEILKDLEECKSESELEKIIEQAIIKYFALQGISEYDANLLYSRGYRDDDAYEIKEGTKLVYAADSTNPFLLYHRLQNSGENDVPPSLCKYRILMCSLIPEFINKINSFGGALVLKFCEEHGIDYSKRIGVEPTMTFLMREYKECIEEFSTFVVKEILPEMNSFISELIRIAIEEKIIIPFKRLFTNEGKESEEEYILKEPRKIYPTIYSYPKTLKARADDIEFDAFA